ESSNAAVEPVVAKEALPWCAASEPAERFRHALANDFQAVSQPVSYGEREHQGLLGAMSLDCLAHLLRAPAADDCAAHRAGPHRGAGGKPAKVRLPGLFRAQHGDHRSHPHAAALLDSVALERSKRVLNTIQKAPCGLCLRRRARVTLFAILPRGGRSDRARHASTSSADAVSPSADRTRSASSTSRVPANRPPSSTPSARRPTGCSSRTARANCSARSLETGWPSRTAWSRSRAS